MTNLHGCAVIHRALDWEIMNFDVTNDQQRRDDQVCKGVPFATVRHNARDGTRVFDGDDFLTENPFARQYGEAKILEIGGGTSDVQPTADMHDPGFSA